MNFKCSINPLATKADCLIVGLFEDYSDNELAIELNKDNDNLLLNLDEQKIIKKDLATSITLYQVTNNAKTLILVGCGKKSEFDQKKYLKVVNHSFEQAYGLNCGSVVVCLPHANNDETWHIQQIVLAAEHKKYQSDQLKTENKKELILDTVHIPSPDETTFEQTTKIATAIAAGVRVCRDVANAPGNICTPSYLAKQAVALDSQFSSITTTVLGEQEITELNMGAFMSVSKGSAQEGKLVTMNYQGGNSKDAPIVLVGKGITFDTGGISIKPSAEMDEMKFDMGGAASVLGTMHAIAQMDLKLNVIGVMACAENMPGGDASKPGDIVTSMSGKTIEIINTDAEGRLVLSDALTYVEQFKPRAVVDVATLTGAMVVALGHHISGMMGNNDELLDELLTAGNQIHDLAWTFPLNEDYKSDLDSNFADISNCGSRAAGAITAGYFLSRFAEKYPWVHIDIAGTAWVSGKQKGATGRPVPLLTQYLINQAHDA